MDGGAGGGGGMSVVNVKCECEMCVVKGVCVKHVPTSRAELDGHGLLVVCECRRRRVQVNREVGNEDGARRTRCGLVFAKKFIIFAERSG